PRVSLPRTIPRAQPNKRGMRNLSQRPPQILPILLFVVLGGLSARGADLKLEAQLIWGTNERTSPNSEHKPIGAELRKKLQELPLRWTNYFEVKRLDIQVPSSGSQRTPLSEKCRLEV